MQLFGRRYDTSQAVRLEIAGERIADVTPVEAPGEDTQRWPWIAPGLVDLQVNGCGGREFNSADLTSDDVAAVIRWMDRFGVTRFCPTLTTERFEVLQGALRVIAAACDGSAEIARRMAGIHLEGPYLSSEDGPRGAHPREYCRRPDWDEFQRLQEAAGGRIRLLTMAAEFDEAPAFIRRAANSGVVVAIGHTAANSDQIRAAVDAGARMSTHLGNGAHPMIHRHSNYIWDQLAEDRLVAGLICDGYHLPPAVVKAFVRAKTPQRCILVSDTVGLAGSPPGRYSSTLGDIEVLESGKLVGASEPIGTGIANVIRFAGVSLAEAVRMAVHHPAQLLGIEPGDLQPGDPADLVLFDLDDRFNVRATIVGGRMKVDAR